MANNNLPGKRLYLDITKLCNNNCLFCYETYKKEDRVHSNKDEIKKKIKTSFEKGISDVVFSGGEPTIHPNFIELVQFAKNLGYTKIRVVTNGRMLSYEDFLNKSVEAGLNEIVFSFYSNKVNTYEKISQVKGSFMQMFKAIKMAAKYNNVRKIANIVVNAKNYELLPSMVRFLKTNNINDIYFSSMVPFGRAVEHPELFIREEDYANRLVEAVELCKEYGMGIRLTGFKNEKFSKYKTSFDKKGSDDFFSMKNAEMEKKGIFPCQKLCEYCYGKDNCSKGRMKYLIKMGYECNNDCLFCHASGNAYLPPLNRDQVFSAVDSIEPMNMILFSGGEPTIRKDILEIAKYVAKTGHILGFVTNGRRFSDKKFTEKMVANNLKFAYVSLHGTEKTHNLLTGTESFNETIEGIKNLLNKGVEVKINFVVNKVNMEELESIILFLKTNTSVKSMKFSFIEPKGKAYEDFENLVPNIREAAEKIKLAVLSAKKQGINILIDGFPLCLVQGLESNSDNFSTNKIIAIKEAFDTDFFHPDKFKEEKYCKPTECKLCKLFNKCDGFYSGYYKKKKENSDNIVRDFLAQDKKII